MNRRPDQKQASTAKLGPYRCTEDEKDEIDATAQYLGLTTSEYLRKLHRENRRKLIEQGLRPPKTPRDGS